MLKRILLNGIITSALQIAFYFCVINIGLEIDAPVIQPQGSTTLEIIVLAMLLKASFIAFGSMLLITNILAAIINKFNWTWILVISSAAIYTIDWGDFNIFPLRTTFLLLTGLAAIFLKFVFDRKVNVLAGYASGLAQSKSLN